MISQYPTDPINQSIICLRQLCNGREIGQATGFFYNVEVNGAPALFLVTAWHIVTGRSTLPPHSALHEKGALPDNLSASLLLNEPSLSHEGKFAFEEVTIPLYGEDGAPLWYQHPLGSKVDIAAMNLGTSTKRFQVSGITDHAHDHDMAIRIGSNICILGYPLGFTQFLRTPIWKHGIIASEPHQEETGQAPRIAIDATTRGGMSGSPVILLANTHYVNESGQAIEKPGARRFVGVYGGRPGIASLEGESTEIGFVYKSGALEQLIKTGTPGLRYGELP